ncbi:MAG: hypothetical protein JSV34_00515 [Candidatus Omnitrophota bacterium]|nr:MAG: hypothetical protein JSV34_00515 [Candidatus Omnitrophota bacterium]
MIARNEKLKIMKGVYLGIVFAVIGAAAAFAHNNIEVDFSNNKVKIVDFCPGELPVKGEFYVTLKKEKDSYIFDIEGKDVSLKDLEFAWVKSRLIKRGDTIFINYFSSPDFMVKGNINLATEEAVLDVDVKSLEGFSFLEGIITAKAKVWGKFGDLVTSGNLNIKKGKYRDREFSHLSLNFLGKLPLVNLTDSKCILKNGNVYKIEGSLNFGDFSNFFPKARFVSEKVALAGWELLFDDKKNVGLKKDVAKEFSVVFDAYSEDDNFVNQGAELRYKLKRNQFLKLRMQDDETIVGFEKKKEF